jgi:hypothetical protein
MIFVVRLHYAIHVINTILDNKDLEMNFTTFPELRDVLMELDFDLKMAEKLDERKRSPSVSTPSPNTPSTADQAISKRITVMETELKSIDEAREKIVKEVEGMRKSIDRVKTCFGNFTNDLKFFQAVTRATLYLNQGTMERSESE